MSLFTDFNLYTLAALLISFFGLVLFELTTKVREFKLIFTEGNIAATLSLGGRFFALTTVLESALMNSVSITDMIVWGSIGIVYLIVLYYIMEGIAFVFGKFKNVDLGINKAIENNVIAVGLLVAFISVGIANLIAGALTY